ncbi:MAG: spore maturation protein [Lachnospira sp.]|nr:spore maturation protein [Lachnospira sp.]
MDFIVAVSAFIIPLIIFYVVAYGVMNKTEVYDVFVEGAKDGIKTVVSILPTLIGLMAAVGILRSSGFLDRISDLLGGVSGKLGLPSQLVPLIIVRMFSSSAATGLSLDLFREYGTDSYIGLITSILMSCTETIFYTMSVYFMAAKVKKTRWTLAGALIATAAGIAASVALARLMC